jgi:hypothetical protein
MASNHIMRKYCIFGIQFISMKHILTFFFSFSCVVVLSSQINVSTTIENKKVLLEGFTGINGYYSTELYKQQRAWSVAYPDDFFYINYHAGIFAEPFANQQDFTTTYGDSLLQRTKGIVFPISTINRRIFSTLSEQNQSQALQFNSISSAIDTVLSEMSPVNIAIRSRLNQTTQNLEIILESYFTSTTNQSLQVNAVVLLDSLVYMQSGSENDSSALDLNGKYIHRNVFFQNINLTNSLLAPSITGTYRVDTIVLSLPVQFNGFPFLAWQPKVMAWISETDSTNIHTLAFSKPTIASDSVLGVILDKIQSLDDFNQICGTTGNVAVEIQNLGNVGIDSFVIEATVNQSVIQRDTYYLNQSLATAYVQKVELKPILNLQNPINLIDLKLISLNGIAYTSNVGTVQIDQASLFVSDSTNGSLSIQFDNYPTDISWRLKDETADTILLSGSNYPVPNSLLTLPFTASVGHCYYLKISDRAGDGLCCAHGSGYYSLNIGNLQIKSERNFESIAGLRFVFQEGVISVQYVESEELDWQIYPNPAQNDIRVIFDENEVQNWSLSNILGQRIMGGNTKGLSPMNLFVGDLQNGVYLFAVADHKGKVFTKKLVISR